VTGTISGNGSVVPFGSGGFQLNSPTAGCDSCNGDGFGLRGSVKVSGRPRICAKWMGQYVDAGPGLTTGFNGKEDFAAETYPAEQQLLASFAFGTLDVTHGTRAIHWSGVLDENGCVPLDVTPTATDLSFTPGAGTGGITMKLTYTSQFCDDPTDTQCLLNATTKTRAGANIFVHSVGDPGPTTLCVTATQNEGLTDPNCQVLHESGGAFSAWDDLGNPPASIPMVEPTLDAVTRISGIVSEMMRREFDSGGDNMGIKLALINRKHDATGTANPELLELVANQPCSGVNDTCAHPDTGKLFIRGTAPPGNLPACDAAGNCFGDDSFWKYVVSHEFGHLIQGRLTGNYSFAYGIVGAGPKCRCDHVTSANQIHCLQSVDGSPAAQVEGFAQFFASKSWNRDDQNDCVFKYYKEFLNNGCMPGGATCGDVTEDGQAFKRTTPPLPLSCNEAVRWRNRICLPTGTSSASALAGMGTEYDWMEFLWAVNTRGDTGSKITMGDLTSVYSTACTGNADNVNHPCAGELLSWVATPISRGLVDGATLLFGANDPRFRQFTNLGDTNGVSTNTSP